MHKFLTTVAFAVAAISPNAAQADAAIPTISCAYTAPACIAFGVGALAVGANLNPKLKKDLEDAGNVLRDAVDAIPDVKVEINLFGGSGYYQPMSERIKVY